MPGNKEIMAENIKYYMARKGVNAAEVCSALGFKTNTFSDWVTAKSYPRIDKIEMMANYFGISKAMLVEDVKEAPIDYMISEEDKTFLIEFMKADNDTRRVIMSILERLKNEH